MSAPVLGSLLAPIDGTPLTGLLRRIGEAAAGASCDVLLVGGLVRDLLLGRESQDVDLVTTSDPALLGAALEDRLGAPLETHPEFRTCTLETASGFRVDLVGARAEEYPAPGALPVTRPGTLREDLARRDFTVNAMAVSLTDPGAELVDPHGGRADLGAGRLRVLHPRSFRDDPTRILRGVRFAAELGFRFDGATRRLAAEPGAVESLGGVSGFRVWRELRMALRGGSAARGVVALVAELGLEPALHPRLAADERTLEALGAATGASAPTCLAIWAGALEPGERIELADRLALDRPSRRVLFSQGARPGAR